MMPYKDLKTVSPNATLFEVFQRMTETDVEQLLVVENEQLVGTIGRNNILSFLKNRAKLGV